METIVSAHMEKPTLGQIFVNKKIKLQSIGLLIQYIYLFIALLVLFCNYIKINGTAFGLHKESTGKTLCYYALHNKCYQYLNMLLFKNILLIQVLSYSSMSTMIH